MDLIAEKNNIVALILQFWKRLITIQMNGLSNYYNALTKASRPILIFTIAE